VSTNGTDPHAPDHCVRVRGARENNLHGVDVAIPRNALAVFTGVSGSGKSSLAFGTIYAEAQRRYFESVAPYARRLLQQTGAPKEYIAIGGFLLILLSLSAGLGAQLVQGALDDTRAAGRTVAPLCWCGERATHNARTIDGAMVTTGSQVVVGKELYKQKGARRKFKGKMYKI